MPATMAANFTFIPQIAERHISGYERKKLVLAKLAWQPRDKRKFNKTPGETITFPYYNFIGDAADGVENQDVEIDALGDASFTATVKEAVKGVGITDSALIKLGDTHAGWEMEAMKQMAFVLAKKIELDLWTELKKSTSRDRVKDAVADISLQGAFGGDKGANDSGYANQLCNIRALAEAMTEGWGDRREEAAAVILHSAHYNSIETDAQAGFLKADANDPLYKIKGFVGRSPMFWGLPFFVNDGVPAEDNVTITDSGSATQDYKTFDAVFLKKDAFGLMMKQLPKVEQDRNIQKRLDFMVATQWYAVKSFHKVISTEDSRILFRKFATKLQA